MQGVGKKTGNFQRGKNGKKHEGAPGELGDGKGGGGKGKWKGFFPGKGKSTKGKGKGKDGYPKPKGKAKAKAKAKPKAKPKPKPAAPGVIDKDRCGKCCFFHIAYIKGKRTNECKNGKNCKKEHADDLTNDEMNYVLQTCDPKVIAERAKSLPPKGRDASPAPKAKGKGKGKGKDGKGRAASVGGPDYRPRFDGCFACFTFMNKGKCEKKDCKFKHGITREVYDREYKENESQNRLGKNHNSNPAP